VNEITNLMQQWKLDKRAVWERMYRSPTVRERERWHAIWLLSLGWTAAQVAEALERDPHTIGEWMTDFRRDGPKGMTFVQTGGCPPLSVRSNKPD
jgi:hypothetical protein